MKIKFLVFKRSTCDMASNRYVTKAVSMGYTSIFAIVAASNIIGIFRMFYQSNDILL